MDQKGKLLYKITSYYILRLSLFKYKIGIFIKWKILRKSFINWIIVLQLKNSLISTREGENLRKNCQQKFPESKIT